MVHMYVHTSTTYYVHTYIYDSLSAVHTYICMPVEAVHKGHLVIRESDHSREVAQTPQRGNVRACTVMESIFSPSMSSVGRLVFRMPFNKGSTVY